jgi:hypothetical protein
MKNDLQKRISLASIAALVAGILAMVPVAPANAATTVALDGTNAAASAGDANESLLMATQRATTAVIHPTTAVATTGHAARSSGLTAKSVASDGTGQTATVRAGGVLSLYAQVSTSVAITADGGSFSSAGISVPSLVSATTSPTTNGKFFANTTGTATPIAVLWQSPTTAGSYTIKLHVSNATSNTITAATALGGTLAADILVTVTAAAHDVVGGTNYPLFPAKADDALFVAVENSTTGASIVSSASTTNGGSLTPRSIGLLSKDSTVITAQSATVLAGGALSLYANASTNVAFIATGGSFSGAVANNSTSGVSYSNDVRTVYIPGTSSQLVAARWSAPTTPGTYTVSMNRANATAQVTSTVGSAGTLTGQITVTVVAASAGGAYSAAYSVCNTADAAGLATGVDTTTAVTNGQVADINFDLDDAYDASLDPGALVVTATNGALVSLGTSGAAAAAGTTSTIVSTLAPTNLSVQIVQGTANAPVTSTVTITYNGTTVCTKTVTIRGEVAKLTVANVGTETLGGSSGSASWIADGTNRSGIFTVTAADSAGNTVAPGTAGVSGFAAVAATLTTTVQAITISSANVATSISSSTAAWNYSVGNFTCGSIAGESKVKVQYTNPSTGTTVTSAEFTARCAGNPYTYTASFDKASYVQGELATLTVQFLDSKGNKANNVGAHGALTDSTPMFTEVTAQGDNVAAKSDGTRTYTYTVGGASAVTAGAYTAIIDFTSLTAVAAVKATPSYEVSTGGDSTTNADVLKSIVALIASINKQIRALQKLILKR